MTVVLGSVLHDGQVLCHQSHFYHHLQKVKGAAQDSTDSLYQSPPVCSCDAAAPADHFI